MSLIARNSDNVRSFVFGVEDSLVSTVGLVSGIAIVGTPKATILLTGMVLIFVEAFSMSVGTLLSDNSAKEFQEQAVVPLKASGVASTVMFVSYLLSGFIILTPYLFLESAQALAASVVLAFLLLFLLGMESGKLTGTSPWRKGVTMAVVGGIAVMAGMAVGLLMDMV